MTKAAHKRLGDFIRAVDVRNRELKVTNLLGVSISKEFMPSVANVIGTDLSNDKNYPVNIRLIQKLIDINQDNEKGIPVFIEP